MWDQDYGVVFSGGGALGSWEIGCYKCLLERFDGKTPSVVTGASAGAINAAGITAGLDISELENHWKELSPSKVYDADFPTGRVVRRTLSRRFLSASGDSTLEAAVHVLREESRGRRGFLNNEPLAKTLHKILNGRGGTFQNSTTRFAITTTNISEGCPEIFYKVEPGYDFKLPQNHYRQVAWTRTESLKLLIQALIGTAAIPILFPPMENRFDGGVLVNQPLIPAVDLGAKNIFVFIPSPVGFEITSDFVDIAQATIATWLASSLVAQFETIALQNEILRERERQQIRLCVVRPQIPLDQEPGVGLLGFGRKVEDLLQLGYTACQERLQRFDPDNQRTWDPYATKGS